MANMIKRLLDLNKFNRSFFLFGPRQVGKTFLIQNTVTCDLYINLLEQSEFLRYSRELSILRKEMRSVKKNAPVIVIDEIQRCPDLLNEVQIIITENPGTIFIMSGSSARKLKRVGTNLLGGRALNVHLHPLTYAELKENYDMDAMLRFGALPSIYLEKGTERKNELLKSYAELYLNEEIRQEAITRNIPAFAHFLELAAFENGNIHKFQNMAREVGVHSKTIKEYFSILEDTLVGFMLFPYKKSARRRLVSHPKFYFFDTGASTALRRESSLEIVKGTERYGRLFEHLIILETKRALDYLNTNAALSFFRTSDGAEADLIIEQKGKVWAVEIKSSSAPRISDIRGLRSFISDHKVDKAFCVCQTPRAYADSGIEFMPWQDYLGLLIKP